MTECIIGPNARVTLHFALEFENGDVIDSNYDGEPASLLIGDGSLPGAFEQKIQSMKAGESGLFTILPEEGFGQPNPNNVQHFYRKDFDSELELAEGLVISFADANKSELPGVVKSVQGDNVIVDFNHPLSGNTLIFKVDIVSVEMET